MGKNKKTSSNAFYYFMLDYKQKQGKSFKSMQDVAEAAGIHWKNMTPEQKRPFEEAAKRERNGIKYTSVNENIDSIKKEDMAKSERENKMKVDIKNTVARNMELGRLADTSFYLIHIHDFFYCRSDKRHYPAEIAVLRFNLNYGVLDSNIYHMIVKPGRLPIGYAAEAKDRASESHQLSLPFGDNSCNLDLIIHDLHQFLKVDFDAANSSYPPLYTTEKEFAKVDNILDFLCDDYGYNRIQFKLYETEHLLYNLRNREDVVWPSISNAKMEIERDPYNFTTGIGCQIHETSEIGYHCSRSYVVRTAFIICDCVCPDMGIDLIAGQHVPADSAETLRQINASASRSASVASERRYHGYNGEDGVSVRSAATGYSKDKTSYSVASSVCNEFMEYDTDGSIKQSDGWNTVPHSRKNNKRDPQKSEWPTLSAQSTSGQLKASQASSSDVAAKSSAVTQPISQDSSQGTTASAASGSQIRRPTSVSVALQFRNLKLPPSSGVGTIGSKTESRPGSSITKGRGRASVMFNTD